MTMKMEQTVFRNVGILNSGPRVITQKVYLHDYEDGTDSVPKRRHIKFRRRGNYPEEIIQHSEHGQSLKSRISVLFEGLTGMFFKSRLSSSVRDITTLRSLTSEDRNKSPWCGRNEILFTAVRRKTRTRTALRFGSHHVQCSGM